jgi:hypothetical protein
MGGMTKVCGRALGVGVLDLRAAERTGRAGAFFLACETERAGGAVLLRFGFTVFFTGFFMTKSSHTHGRLKRIFLKT